MAKKVLHGVCYFWSETGTEGGHWAFQDRRFITENVAYGYCKNCGKWLHKQEGLLQVTRVHIIDQQFQEELLRTGKVPERPECPDNIHEEDRGNSFDYQGLHVLKNGDHLTIFDKKNPKKVIWDGVIDFAPHGLFTEHAMGMWIHASQNGIGRGTWGKWFMQEYPAKLIPAPEKPNKHQTVK